MDIDTARRFLASNHRAVMVTRRSDGRLQTSPVTALLDAEGRVMVATRAPTAKARNLTRDPRVALCVFAERWPGPWLHVDGEVEILRLPEALPALADFYQRRSGEDTTTETFRQRMFDEERVLVRMEIASAAGRV